MTTQLSDNPTKAIIFDMDGLMVDTEPLSRQAWQAVLAEYGYELTDAVYLKVIGRRSDACVQILEEVYPIPLTGEELIERKKARLAARLSKGIPVMPGLFELQAAIKKRGIAWGVATSSSRSHAVQVLTQLNLIDHCGAIAAGNEVENGKPAPDIYLLAAKRLGYTPENCLALEDSLPGCHAAHAAGLFTIAIPNGETHQSDFDFVDRMFASLNEVATNLDELLCLFDKA